MAEPDDNVQIPLGMLTSDAAGYVSFDFTPLSKAGFKSLKHLWVYAVGEDKHRVDILGLPRVTGIGHQFLLTVEANSVKPVNGRHNLASIQSADVVDWKVSPHSFTAKVALSLGEGSCEGPYPSSLAEREFTFYKVVRRSDGGDETDNTAISSPVNLLHSRDSVENVVRFGEMLEFKQSWFPLGHSLGQLLYSLPLAPCESINIAVIEWSRQDTIKREDFAKSTEWLFHEHRRDRVIEEVLNAGLRESQGGWSILGGLAGSQAQGGSASVAIDPISIALSKVGSLVGSIGGGVSHSSGNRNVTANSNQELHDLITQASSSIRALSSTVVVQASQAESNLLQTRTVTNHNHCHALTIQYYEVLRNFRIVTEFIRRRRVVFIPYVVFGFTRHVALRFRTILERVLLAPTLLPCFDALVRLGWSTDLYEETPVTVPETTKKEIKWFELTLKTGTEGFATTSGDIWVELLCDGVWKQLFYKKAVKFGGVELTKSSFTTHIDVPSGTELAIDPLNITRVRVAWREHNDWDHWHFKAIKILYGVNKESGSKVLIDREGTDVPAGAPEPVLKWFDNSGQGENDRQEWTSDADTHLPTNATPQQPDLPKDSSKPQSQYSRKNDENCEAQLLTHLNSNIGFYNRAIWLLQDPLERRRLLENSLGGNSRILDGIDDLPLAVDGCYVAFAYNALSDGDIQDEDVLESESIISLPTRGLFAEAELGNCNACEKRDVTRFWKWEESPCDKPPTISGITPGPKGQGATVQGANLPNPVIQVVNPPAAPDPAGLAAALDVLKTPNIFRDMSGIAEVSKLLDGLVSGAVDLSTAQELAKQAKAKQAEASQQGNGGKGKTKSAPSEMNPEKQVDKVNAIKYAKDDLGLIDDREAAAATTGVLGGVELTSSDEVVNEEFEIEKTQAGGTSLENLTAGIVDRVSKEWRDAQFKDTKSTGNVKLIKWKGNLNFLHPDYDRSKYGLDRAAFGNVTLDGSFVTRVEFKKEGLSGSFNITWEDCLTLPARVLTEDEDFARLDDVWWKANIGVENELSQMRLGENFAEAEIKLEARAEGIVTGPEWPRVTSWDDVYRNIRDKKVKRRLGSILKTRVRIELHYTIRPKGKDPVDRTIRWYLIDWGTYPKRIILTDDSGSGMLTEPPDADVHTVL
jgi:hypothetical protein